MSLLFGERLVHNVSEFCWKIGQSFILNKYSFVYFLFFSTKSSFLFILFAKYLAKIINSFWISYCVEMNVYGLTFNNDKRISCWMFPYTLSWFNGRWSNHFLWTCWFKAAGYVYLFVTISFPKADTILSFAKKNFFLSFYPSHDNDNEFQSKFNHL